MSVINFDVIDKIVRRRDGFNPVRGERNYTKLHFDFERGYGWDECTVVTASFFASADEIFHEPAIVSNNAAEFNIPTEFSTYRGRLFIGIQGTYQSNGRIVTIATTIVWIDIDKGILIEQGANQNLYEKLIALFSDKYIYATPQMYGAKGDGETDDTAAIKQAIEENNLVIFPEGEYLTSGVSVANLSDRTLWARGAEVKFDGNGGSVFHFENCDNINIVGGTYKGMSKAKYGLNFFDSKNVSLDGVSVQNVGNSDIVGASGINFVGNCSNSKLIDASVDGVTSGIPDATGYIFAHGIGFIRSGISGRYSQNVEIIHPVISNVGYVDGENYVDAEPVTVIVGGSEVTHYEVGGVTCNPDIMDGSHARIDGDGIFIVQSKGVGGVHDGAESFFNIKNVDISHCSKRALKIVARCVDVDGGEIDVATWSAAVEVQRVRNNSLRNLNISDTAYTPVTINGGDGPMVIENCRITGGGMSSNGSGGIVLGAKSTGLVEGSEIVHIKNCVFDNTRYPIYAAIGSAAGGKTDCEELVIKDCLIKHFYGDAAVKLEAGRYQRLGNLAIENVSFLYGDSGREVYKANNDFYNQSISLSSHLFKILISPEESLKVICHSIIDDLREKFNSLNLSTPRQVFEEPLQPTDVFEITEHLDMTDGNYTSSEDSGGNVFTAEVYDKVIALDAENAFQSATPLLEIPLASDIELNPGDNITLSVRNSKPRQNYSGNSADNALLVNFYTANGRNLAYNDQNYSASSKGYAAQSALKEYAIKLNNSMTLSKLAVTLNFSGTGTVTPGTELKISVKTKKLLAEDKADKADTNAQFERLIAVLQNKAGKAETLAGYGINDAYTKAEVDALINVSGKENTSNKVTSVSSSSTNAQYPSALAVYNAIQTAIGGVENGSY